MFSVAVLVLCGVSISAAVNDLCLNKTEYDFYIIENLVKDFQKRFEQLKENVNGKIFLYINMQFSQVIYTLTQKDSFVLFER